MILTVTLNAALDVTYDVDALVPHGSHRVRRVRERAGGKGVNVASVLHAMGHRVVATGLAGGGTGRQLRDDLRRRGIDHDFVAVAGESRRTVTVVDAASGDATIFNEPGPEVSGVEWRHALGVVEELVVRRRPAVVVLAGSLPRGLDGTAYGELVEAVRRRGARTVLDADGPTLLAAVAARPDVVKPNLAELLAATGCGDLASGAARLHELGAGTVVVSAGPDGVTAVSPTGATTTVRPPEALAGNPTGAGDAMVAALAAGLADGLGADDDWREVLADAVAWSAAAVLQPLAGAVDPDDVARLRARTS